MPLERWRQVDKAFLVYTARPYQKKMEEGVWLLKKELSQLNNNPIFTLLKALMNRSPTKMYKW